jgi:hypothetical protein
MIPSFDIDWQKWISDNLNPRRRKPKRIALLKALAKRIIDIHSEFLTVHNANVEKLSWNGQRMLLQRYLQLKFGDGILIENSSSASLVAIEYEAPNLANAVTFVAPEFTNPIHGQGGDAMLGANFVVKVPVSIVFNENEMRAVINNYLINYKNYIIQLI